MADFKWLVSSLTASVKELGLRGRTFVSRFGIFCYSKNHTKIDVYKTEKQRKGQFSYVCHYCFKMSVISHWRYIWHNTFHVLYVITGITDGRKKIASHELCKRSGNKYTVRPKFYRLSWSSDNLLQINATTADKSKR